jgi:acyl-CoA synthetase (AMP-forming)/AMP-acid ligase II
VLESAVVAADDDTWGQVPVAHVSLRAGATATVDDIVAAASLDDLCPPFDDDPQVNLRWILTHLLEETARHAGHADILRELIDGDTGR